MATYTAESNSSRRAVDMSIMWRRLLENVSLIRLQAPKHCVLSVGSSVRPSVCLFVCLSADVACCKSASACAHTRSGSFWCAGFNFTNRTRHCFKMNEWMNENSAFQVGGMCVVVSFGGSVTYGPKCHVITSFFTAPSKSQRHSHTSMYHWTLQLRSSPGSRFALALSPSSRKFHLSYAPPSVTTFVT